MPNNEIGTLNVTIAPDALREIISSGRLLELAGIMAREAAAQISAQLVEHVAASAAKGDGLKTAVGANVSFIFDGGDFGTRPPRPHWGVVNLGDIAGTPLRQVAGGQALGAGGD